MPLGVILMENWQENLLIGVGTTVIAAAVLSIFTLLFILVRRRFIPVAQVDLEPLKLESKKLSERITDLDKKLGRYEGMLDTELNMLKTQSAALNRQEIRIAETLTAETAKVLFDSMANSVSEKSAAKVSGEIERFRDACQKEIVQKVKAATGN